MGNREISGITIEEMKLIHIPMVLEVERKSFAVPWSKQSFIDEFNNHLAVYYVAERADIVTGYVGMWEIFDEGHITNIAVDPQYRRLKIGTYLMEAIIKRASEKGIESITLEVRSSNDAAILMYQKFGFYVDGIRKRYYADNGEDALIMWRKKKK